jgi:uridine kinase
MARARAGAGAGAGARSYPWPMDLDPDALAAMVASQLPRAGNTRVVAVDGPSGSGKTVLAALLSASLGAAPVVHMDDLYPGWDGLQDAVPRLVEWVLGPLSHNARARYRRFDWPTGRYAEWHEVPPAPVLVVEGVGCGARACTGYLSTLVWVEAPGALRFARGIERDGEAYRPHWERWAKQEDAHFATEGTRSRADVRVDTTTSGAWQALAPGEPLPTACR